MPRGRRLQDERVQQRTAMTAQAVQGQRGGRYYSKKDFVLSLQWLKGANGWASALAVLIAAKGDCG